MELIFNQKELLFEKVDIFIEEKDIANVFQKYSNRSLNQILAKPRYKSVLQKIENIYNDCGAEALGDFLFKLKISNNDDYRFFLNPSGDLLYCKFSIKTHLDKRGIYIFYDKNEILYLGRCINDFNKRFNQGYGIVSPKNCYRDGQSTNCRLNALVNSSYNSINIGIYSMMGNSNSEIVDLEKQLINKFSFVWNLRF